jgi:hypothetical protein
MEAIWNANPTVNMLYCFEDGNCFIKHSEAASYAQSNNMHYIVKVRETEDNQIENKPIKTNKK